MNDKSKESDKDSSATAVNDENDLFSASNKTLECKNKIRRRELYSKLKREKKKEKRKRQDARKKVAKALGDDAPPKLVPKTIDSMREYDETTVVKAKEVPDRKPDKDELRDTSVENTQLVAPDEEDEEVNW